jgi:hypothetical protein
MATDEAYEAAAVAFRLGDPLAPPWSGTALERRIRLAVNAVWDLAVAEGRRQAAEAIRAATPLRIGASGSWATTPELVEWAARIAAGETPSIDPDQDVWDYLDGEVNDAAAS